MFYISFGGYDNVPQRTSPTYNYPCSYKSLSFLYEWPLLLHIRLSYVKYLEMQPHKKILNVTRKSWKKVYNSKLKWTKNYFDLGFEPTLTQRERDVESDALSIQPLCLSVW